MRPVLSKPNWRLLLLPMLASTEVADLYCGCLVTTFTTPPGSCTPYSTEDGPFSTSTRSAVGEKMCVCDICMPLRSTELSRLSPKPRFTTASSVPAKVLAWRMPLTVCKASSRDSGRRSANTAEVTTFTLRGTSDRRVYPPPTTSAAMGW